MIKQIETTLLPITEFRKNLSSVLDTLNEPKVLMNRDKPQAVLVPIDMYKQMEEQLENKYDEILVQLAADRVAESAEAYIAHDDFWDELNETD